MKVMTKAEMTVELISKFNKTSSKKIRQTIELTEFEQWLIIEIYKTVI